MAVAGIYLGRIAKWNDPAIAALNPGTALPDKAIAPIHRSDGSGTNFIFTHYLSSIDPQFKDKIGENTSVDFPSGLGGKGNEGVAALTGRTDGAIGYVEYAYALQNKMTYTLLRNRDGAFVAPDSKTFQAAATNADWSKAAGFYLLLTDPARRGQLADHRRELHPDAQRAGQARHRARRARVFRLGLPQRRTARRGTRLRPDAGECRQSGRRQLETDRRARRQAGMGRPSIVIDAASEPAHALCVIRDAGAAGSSG